MRELVFIFVDEFVQVLHLHLEMLKDRFEGRNEGRVHGKEALEPGNLVLDFMQEKVGFKDGFVLILVWGQLLSRVHVVFWLVTFRPFVDTFRPLRETMLFWKGFGIVLFSFESLGKFFDAAIDIL